MRAFLTKHVRGILAVSIVVQCLCVLLFLYSFAQIRRMAEQNTKIFMDNYVEKVSDELNRNNTYMHSTILSSREYYTLFQKTGMERISLLADLQEDYAMLNELSERRYNYFACNLAGGEYLEITAVKVPFSSYEGIRFDIRAAVGQERQNGEWYLTETQSGDIALMTWRYNNFILGVWIDEASLLSGISMLDYGENGGMGLVPYEGKMENSHYAVGFGTSTLYYELQNCGTDFGIQVLITQNSAMIWLMVMQIIQFVLASLAIILLAVTIWHLSKNFVIPVSNLTNILNKYQPKEQEEKKIREAVGDAHQILGELGAQMENLEVRLYESELEKKQLEINFRNLQIRPHFFVNCLAMIQGMADVNDVEKIRQMTVCLSEYYRYVLHDCMDMVPLWQEIYHMGNVARVNEAWSTNTFTFTQQMEEAVKEVEIPVLSVSTFLENAIRHSVGTIKIHLIAMTDIDGSEEKLFLRIEDNGRGFSEALTESLNRGEPVKESEGRHIGINNVMQRLYLIYGNRARVHFSRGEMGGACVEMWIPKSVNKREE